MALTKVPTGTTIMPPEVLKKAKNILEEIGNEERLGTNDANALSDFDELEDDKKCMVALKGAILLKEGKHIT